MEVIIIAAAFIAVVEVFDRIGNNEPWTVKQESDSQERRRIGLDK